MNPTRAVDSCAADLRASPGATADTHAIRGRFAEVDARYRSNLAAGMGTADAMRNTPPMIPDQVATVGGQDKTRRGEVLKMIQCAGDRAGLSSGVTSELQGMYRDATNAKSGNFLNFILGR
ncbi:hypothetical protein L6R52_17210 [Myxococcota bacterium]|nr:hypothetical protein [Myxococcota bacterium]